MPASENPARVTESEVNAVRKELNVIKSAIASTNDDRQVASMIETFMANLDAPNTLMAFSEGNPAMIAGIATQVRFGLKEFSDAAAKYMQERSSSDIVLAASEIAIALAMVNDEVTDEELGQIANRLGVDVLTLKQNVEQEGVTVKKLADV